ANTSAAGSSAHGRGVVSPADCAAPAGARPLPCPPDQVHSPRAGTMPTGRPAPSAFSRPASRQAASIRTQATRWAVAPASQASNAASSRALQPAASRRARQAAASRSIRVPPAMSMSIFGLRRARGLRPPHLPASVEMLGDQPHALGQLLLDRLLAHAQARGDFLLRQLLVPPQPHHLAAAAGQAVEGHGQPLQRLPTAAPA